MSAGSSPQRAVREQITPEQYAAQLKRVAREVAAREITQRRAAT